ncbi:hypothetical protein [uncultured Ruthenibacterium sp.]|uniref:hypothetical protein n=1 Tax=uncultured Ruthenibacterium sp. TaxID=1905347 RepID=UPI00349E6135
MAMDHDGMRSYAMTLAHRAVKDIRRDGFRQLRGYVDMGLILARGPGQKLFFSTAQRLLAKADSAYYPLVQRMLDEVAENQLCTLAVNLGVEALATGVVELRRQAAQGAHPVWMVWEKLENAEEVNAFHQAVSKAQMQGTRLFCADCEDSTLAQALLHRTSFDCRESLFFLRIKPASVTPDLIRALRAAENAVPLLMVPGEEELKGCFDAAEHLRREKLFFGLFYKLPNGAKLEAEQVHRLAELSCLCVLETQEEKSAQKALQKAVSAQRKAPDAPIFLVDWRTDSRSLEKYISAGASIHLSTPDSRL